VTGASVSWRSSPAQKDLGPLAWRIKTEVVGSDWMVRRVEMRDVRRGAERAFRRWGRLRVTVFMPGRGWEMRMGGSGADGVVE
jgi:hypothetical protein